MTIYPDYSTPTPIEEPKVLNSKLYVSATKFHKKLDDFLHFCRTFSASFETESISQNTTTHIVYRDYYPFWWYRPQTVVNNNYYYTSNQVKKDAKKESKKYDMTTQVILFISGLTILAGGVYFTMNDYVEYYKMNKGKKIADICKKKIVKHHQFNNDDNIFNIVQMIDTFEAVHKITATYHKFNMFAKMLMTFVGINLAIGGIAYGSSYYSDAIIYANMFGTVVSVITYITNNRWFSLCHKENLQKYYASLVSTSIRLMNL